MPSVLFIHRSVGQNLLDDGNLQKELENTSSKAGIPLRFKEINNNLNGQIPGADTKPADYLRYFETHVMPEDLVVIKSCYPNNAIKSDAELRIHQQTYLALVEAFIKKSPGKLLIMTTPPLRPTRTNTHEARRARDLALWLERQPFSNRVSVFDFYSLLAEDSTAPQANQLKRRYRRLLPWDNHPNKVASRTIAPILARKIVSFLA